MNGSTAGDDGVDEVDDHLAVFAVEFFEFPEALEFIALEERVDKDAWLRARGISMPAEYWNDVSMGPKEDALTRNRPLIDPRTAAAIAKAQARCHCASGF